MKISNAAALAANDAVAALVDAGPSNGYLELRTGAEPANADDAPTGTLLATLPASDPAFAASTDSAPGALAAANSFTSDTNCANSGLAGHFRLCDSNGVCVAVGTVGGLSSGADIEMDDPNIVQAGTAAITSFNLRHPE